MIQFIRSQDNWIVVTPRARLQYNNTDFIEYVENLAYIVLDTRNLEDCSTALHGFDEIESTLNLVTLEISRLRRRLIDVNHQLILASSDDEEEEGSHEPSTDEDILKAFSSYYSRKYAQHRD